MVSDLQRLTSQFRETSTRNPDFLFPMFRNADLVIIPASIPARFRLGICNKAKEGFLESVMELLRNARTINRNTGRGIFICFFTQTGPLFLFASPSLFALSLLYQVVPNLSTIINLAYI